MSTTPPPPPPEGPPPPPGGYGAPPPPPPPPPGGYGGAPGYGQPMGQPPDNYLVWAILSTILCCLPLGIVSIVFSTQVNSKWAMGDAAGAMESSRKAKQFAMWSAIVAVIGIVLYLILIFAIGGLSFMSST